MRALKLSYIFLRITVSDSSPCIYNFLRLEKGFAVSIHGFPKSSHTRIEEAKTLTHLPGSEPRLFASFFHHMLYLERIDVKRQESQLP